MRTTASGDLTLRRNPATGRVGFARVAGAHPDLLPGVAAEGRQGAIGKATRYLDRFAVAFGARPGELQRSEVYADRGGWSVTFTQSYRGVPVFGAELKAEVNREGALTSVNGFAAPDLSLSTTPRLSDTEASARALALVRVAPDGYRTSEQAPTGYRHGLRVRSNELMIYRTGSPRGIDGENRLAWVAEVSNRTTIRESVILDAATGKPLNRWTMITDALTRDSYEAFIDDNGTPGDPNDDFLDYHHAWVEGDAFPGTLDQDQRNAVLGTGETYWMFRNTFGYDAWDGFGGDMVTVTEDPFDCPNAFWNGFVTNFCAGITSDDTLGHEWGHAYTESTSGLIYQWQPGAMNEAYSDIWGETIDQLNARDNQVGETPADLVRRTEGSCSAFTRTDITFEITAPPGIIGPCTAAPAFFGPVINQAGVTGTAVVGTDDDTDGSSPTDGCSPFDNAADLAGVWVYVDRGTCIFQTKAQNAADAGAVGVVVGNNAAGQDPFSMTGLADVYGVMVSLEDGLKFKNAGEPVSFEVAAVPAEVDESFRWLQAESNRPYGGAIRDMWNPQCYGDPGRVSDEEYHCDATDGGGVHHNAGVVNRTFAMLVDGLPGTLRRIGIHKAGWLFWYTQTHYLTPMSTFADLADGLEASCAALQGVNLTKISLGHPHRADGADGGVVLPKVITGGTTARDCNRVHAASRRPGCVSTRPSSATGGRCCCPVPLTSTAVTTPAGRSSYREDFEDGLDGWTQDEELTFPEGHGYPWEASTSAPGGHPGGVAFGANPNEGDCSGGPNDTASRNGLISPDLTVPAGLAPRLSFEHYVATEGGFDGGNVKVSVNGGGFEHRPARRLSLQRPGACPARPPTSSTATRCRARRPGPGPTAAG